LKARIPKLPVGGVEGTLVTQGSPVVSDISNQKKRSDVEMN